MRGRANVPDCSPLGKGITPAYAGKSCCPILRLACTRDHPRVCGEEENVGHTYKKRLGSPPRMRGRVCMTTLWTSQNGITPAYAGKSLLPSENVLQVEDHPRVCGEEHFGGLALPVVEGSPPRMRGRAAGVRPFRWAVGITPAYAGKSSRCSPLPLGGRDHPRVCGEERAKRLPLDLILGSPPRMRGRESNYISTHQGGRITPAYAGKSLTGQHPKAGQWDHPRVCGEEPGFPWSGLSVGGSPPRMRGRVQGHRAGCSPKGITPAYAGKS